MIIIYKLLILAALTIAVAWAISSPGYESIGVAVGALAALILVFFIDQKRKASGQSQDVAAGGIGIQAGRDANNAKVTKK